MDMVFIGLTFAVAGKVLLGVAVVKVHSRVAKDRAIDDAVIRELQAEQSIAILGIVLIVAGYLLHIAGLGYLS